MYSTDAVFMQFSLIAYLPNVSVLSLPYALTHPPRDAHTRSPDALAAAATAATTRFSPGPVFLLLRPVTTIVTA